MKFKAVLFDLDGTLLDTIEDLADSMNAALARFGFPAHDLAAYKKIVGEGVEHLAFHALPENQRSSGRVKKCIQAMREEYGLRWDQKTKPYAGIPDLLDGLICAKMKMSILSNKPDDFTKAIAKKFLSRWTFAGVIGSREKVPKKPDPACALELAQAMSVKSEEVLYLGDTKVDMETASAAGMFPAGALWGFRTREELQMSGAKIFVEHPLDLLKWMMN